MIYRFNWSAIGTNDIDADSLEEAQALFDAMTLSDLWSAAVSQEFTQDNGPTEVIPA
jgi:hypothetical protein